MSLLHIKLVSYKTVLWETCAFIHPATLAMNM